MRNAPRNGRTLPASPLEGATSGQDLPNLEWNVPERTVQAGSSQRAWRETMMHGFVVSVAGALGVPGGEKTRVRGKRWDRLGRWTTSGRKARERPAPRIRPRLFTPLTGGGMHSSQTAPAGDQAKFRFTASSRVVMVVLISPR